MKKLFSVIAPDGSVLAYFNNDQEAAAWCEKHIGANVIIYTANDRDEPVPKTETEWKDYAQDTEARSLD